LVQNGTLSTRQRAGIAALLSERTLTDAASKAGVNRHTLTRWLRDTHFRDAVRAAQDAALADAVRRFAGGMGNAQDALQAVMNDAQAPPGVRVRAAQVWLEQECKAREMHELTERIAALEQQSIGGIE